MGDKENARGIWGPLAYFFPILGPVIVLLARQNAFSRFHAVQSILATVALFLVGILLRVFAFLPIFGFLYRSLFWVLQLAVVVLWVFLMYKAWLGQRYKLPFLGDWAAGDEEPPASAPPATPPDGPSA